jgi:hypothetical protein
MRKIEEQTEVNRKLCEIDDIDDFNCIDCPDFDNCQMILYDSYDEADDDRQVDETGLTII